MKKTILSRFLAVLLLLVLSIAQVFGAFTHYTGTISGTDHSLVDMLDTNLVNAGWTVAFTSGTSIRVYKNGTGSSGRYWYVRDNGPNVTSTYKEAWIRGYGTKADANDTADASNTLQFPTAAQMTNGAVIRKSASADATARTYHMYADARTCILIIYTGDNAGQAMIHYFGDFYNLTGSASLAAVTACRIAENSATQTNDALQSFTGSGEYIIQAYTGAGSALAGTSCPLGLAGSSVSYSLPQLIFPNGPDGGRYLGQMALLGNSNFNATTHYYGRMRGIWYPLAGQTTFADLDTLSGAGALAGRAFTLHKCGSGFYAIETSDTLESN